jgi:hypothetical protein
MIKTQIQRVNEWPQNSHMKSNYDVIYREIASDAITHVNLGSILKTPLSLHLISLWPSYLSLWLSIHRKNEISLFNIGDDLSEQIDEGKITR